MQRAHAAHQEIGLERAEDRALPFADGAIRVQNSSSFAPASTPATTSEWPLSTLVAACMTMSAPRVSGRVWIGRGGGRIDRETRAGLMGDLGGARDIGDRPKRVRGRLDPDELGLAGLHRLAQGLEIVGLHEIDIEAPAHGLRHQPVRRAQYMTLEATI